MSNDNRVPSGVPSGGQFAASMKAEADVDLHTSEVRFSAEDTQALVNETLRRAGAALQAASDDLPNYLYFGARAQTHAEAFWLLQRPEVPGVDETSNASSEFLHETLDHLTGSHPTVQAQEDLLANLGPYAPLDAEHADAIADHFLIQAARSSDALAGPRTYNDPHDYHDGARMVSTEYAVAFRTGQVTPDRAAVLALREHLVARAIDQQMLPAEERTDPTAAQARALYDEAVADL